jgi:hypothetical protein
MAFILQLNRSCIQSNVDGCFKISDPGVGPWATPLRQIYITYANTVQIVGMLRRRKPESLRENNYILVGTIIHHFTIKAFRPSWEKAKLQGIYNSNYDQRTNVDRRPGSRCASKVLHRHENANDYSHNTKRDLIKKRPTSDLQPAPMLCNRFEAIPHVQLSADMLHMDADCFRSDLHFFANFSVDVTFCH